MARIREYTTQESASANIATQRVEASGIGAGLETAGNALMSFADRKAAAERQREVSGLETTGYELRQRWTGELQRRAAQADLNDPDFSTKFAEDLQTDLQDFGVEATTPAARRVVETMRRQIAADLVERAGVMQAGLTGEHARQSYLRGLDANRNTLLTDPTQFQSVLNSTLDSLRDPEGAYAKIPTEKRLELERTTRADLALSAVQGLIERDPVAAKQEIASGRWADYLDADKAAQMNREADVAIRAEQIERARLDAAAEKALEQQRQQTMDGFLQKLFDANGPALSTRDVLRSNLKPEQKEHYIKLIETANKPGDIKTNPTTFVGLYDRIHLPDGDKNKLVNEDDLDQYLGRGLSLDSLRQLRDEMRGKRSSEGQVEDVLKKGLIDVAKSYLTKSNSLTGFRDPKGDEALQGFMTWFLPEFQKQRQSGATAVELLSPDSPKYLGKMIDRYRRPFADVLRDLAPAAPGGNSPRPAAPEPADYGSAADVTAAFKAGKLTREQAGKILRDKGWARSGPAGATSSAVDQNGNYIYLLNGQWVDASGNAVK